MSQDSYKSSRGTHESHRRRMERRVFAAVLIVALSYFLLIFPEEVGNLLFGKSERIITILIRAGLTVSITPVLIFVFFASDSAFKGRSKTAKWVRSIFAANAATKAYKCTEQQSSALWFKYFDTWEFEKSPQRTLLERSYAATYMARLVFYLQRTFIIFLTVGVITVLVNWKFLSVYEDQSGTYLLVAHIIVLLLYAIGFLALRVQNRISSKDAPALGCWLKLEDVFGRSQVFFEYDVIKHASTLDEAFEVVNKIRGQVK